MKRYQVVVTVVLILLSGACQKEVDSRITVEPFDLKMVTLLDGPFKHAMELNIRSLLNYEPDRLLAKFRTEAGLEPKAEHYHGWEDNTIAGHSLGHYLSACALMYQSTGDDRFLERVGYIVDELEAVQNANGDGYIGAFPDGKKILMEFFHLFSYAVAKIWVKKILAKRIADEKDKKNYT